MNLIDDDDSAGCSFIWTIENFTYCWHKSSEKLESPPFVLGESKSKHWTLYVIPRSGDSEDMITVGVTRDPCAYETNVKGFSLSILTANGRFKKERDSTYTFADSKKHHMSRRASNLFSSSYNSYQVKLIKRKELLIKGSNAYLDNNIMTLRCRIWKINDILLPTGECHARTIIAVERNTFLWSLGDYQEKKCLSKTCMTIDSQGILPYFSTLDVNLINYSGNLFAEDNAKLEIKQKDPQKPSLATCKITLLDADGKIIHSIRDEYVFERAPSNLQVWTPPFSSISKILDCKDMYIRCELATSSGVLWSCIEQCENKPANLCRLFASEERASNFSDTWHEDIHRFYMDNKLTDLIIRTPSKDFPVHKVILCSRSEVFYTIFQHDMEENRSGVIEIIDIDADTIERLLTFVYSDKVEELDCDSALKLYYASDKYRISALKRKCFEFFKCNMSICDACDVLVLAITHQDQDLKLFVQEYIMKNPVVMGSEKWKKLSIELPQLTFELMQSFFKRNLQI